MTEKKGRTESRKSDRPEQVVAAELKEKRDAFLQTFFKRGAELTDELLGENGRLRDRLSRLEAENASLKTQLASDNAIFTCDVGTPTVWAARYLTMNGRRRLLGSFSHGSMACAVPQAIGAQSAFPSRQVVTLSGDGGVAMMLGDLLTLRQQKLPIKLVVFNNGALAFVELEMKAAGIVTYATDLDNPSFAALARWLCPGVPIEWEHSSNLTGFPERIKETEPIHYGVCITLKDVDELRAFLQGYLEPKVP